MGARGFAFFVTAFFGAASSRRSPGSEDGMTPPFQDLLFVLPRAIVFLATDLTFGCIAFCLPFPLADGTFCARGISSSSSSSSMVGTEGSVSAIVFSTSSSDCMNAGARIFTSGE